MRQDFLAVIRDEHQALAAMLRSLSLLLAEARRKGEMPDFDVLRAMVFYIDEFPERLHHAKESALLFPLLRERSPELRPVLDRLEMEHGRGEQAIREIEHALLAFETLGESRRAVFEEAVEHYIDFYLQHMGLEEREVLPAADRVLTPAERSGLDDAFARNRDPLTGHEPQDEYRPLFRRIVHTAKAPVGLG